MKQLLFQILAGASATLMSISVVFLVHILGQYRALEQQDRPDPELQQFRYPSILILITLWISGGTFLLIVLTLYFELQYGLSITLSIFLVGLALLIIGLTWLSGKVIK